MNYKCFQGQSKQARFNCAINLELIKKNNKLRDVRITYVSSPKKSERVLFSHFQSQKQIANHSPLRIDFKYTENQQNIRITSPQSS